METLQSQTQQSQDACRKYLDLTNNFFFFFFTTCFVPCFTIPTGDSLAISLSGHITSYTMFMIVYHPSQSPGGSDEIMCGSRQRGVVYHCAADSFVLFFFSPLAPFIKITDGLDRRESACLRVFH